MSDELNPQPEKRPQPQYGELAPEGWSWKPEGEVADGDASGAHGAAGPSVPNTSSGYSPTQQGRQVPTPQGQVPGVPHNLGVGGASRGGQSAVTPPSSSQPTPGPITPAAGGHRHAGNEQSYRGAPPPGAVSPQQNEPSAPQTQHYPAAPQYQYSGTMSGIPPRQNRQADRVVSIILLAIGALGALYTALAIYQMSASFHLIAAMVGLENFTVPEAIQTISTVGALSVLALYAVTLIFSVQRLRARKLTFWVPLSAGVLAVILFFVFTFIAAAQMPELMEHLADPNAAAQILDGAFG